MRLEKYLLIVSLICIISVVCSKLFARFGIPALLLFLALGMLMGSDGIAGISFDDYGLTEHICSAALLFIMFYGGFGTNWDAAKPVAVKSILLSTFGVILTALITGVFCYFVLRTSLLEGLLIGAVLGSTDAASVFSILRGKKLNLTGGLASLLEIESGSNDPIAYMLTIIILGLMQGNGAASLPLLLFKQIFFGLAFGAAIGCATAFLMKKFSFHSNGMHLILVFAVAISAYSMPVLLGGNGFLSVYIAGIILGNSAISDKIELVHFFDGLTGIMQILLFFTLGLLSFPSQMLLILPSAALIALFLTLVARPLAVFAILTPFKVPFRQQLLVSWAGLRGAASIVFAIATVVSPAYTKNDIFHIAFFVCLLSVAIQGSLLPLLSRRLGLIEKDCNVFRTFNDYQDAKELNLIEVRLSEGHPWVGQTLSDISMPKDMLAVMVKREGETLIPNGSTRIRLSDSIIISCSSYTDNSNVNLSEVFLDKDHPWVNQPVNNISLPDSSLIVMVRRGQENFIPDGNSMLKKGDTLILCSDV